MKNKIKKLTAFLVTAMLTLSVPLSASAEVPKDAAVYGNNAYKCYKSSMSRAMASSECKKMGGHLVYINSTGEKNFLSSEFDVGTYWVGALYTGGTWKWDSGEAVKDSFWAGTKPAVAGIDYAVTFLPGADINGAVSAEEHYYICEWENGALPSASTTAQTTQPTTPSTNVTEPHATVPSTAAPETTTALSGIFPGVPETVSGVTKLPQPSIPSSSLSAPETVLTLPTTPDMTEVQEPGVTNYFDSLDIGDTIYIYDDSFYYQIVGGKEIIISYYAGIESDIDIPASIDGRPVSYIAARAFQGQSVSSVAIPPSVTTIDDTSFGNISKDFIVYGKKGTEAESFALRHGYGFVEKAFDDDNGGTDGDEDSGEELTGTTITSTKKLTKIVIVLSVLVLLAAVGVFFGVKRYYSFIPPMGPRMLRPGDEDEDEDESDDDDESDEDESDEDESDEDESDDD